VATSLRPGGDRDRGFGRYLAESYLDLVDHPVEMGRFSRVEFEVAGVPHALVISGRHRADMERLAVDLGRVCAQQVALFGELPCDRYLFMALATGDGYGGLEHRFSTSLICGRSDLPRPGVGGVDKGYRKFLGLCSHEYFHLWNVKRIRPRVFQEQGLEREVHTRLLWVFEGITSYYDDLALVRSGLIEAEAYLELLAAGITRLLRGNGRHKQSLEASSFDAWTKFYKQDESAPNNIVSYYTKGAIVALALDLRIRRDTGGERSLDHLMRRLWNDFGKTGCGLGEDEIEPLIAAVTGLDLSLFLERALRGTEDLDLAPLLGAFGVAMRLRPARDGDDQGGLIAAQDEAAQPAQPVLGVRLDPADKEAVLACVLDGGAAQSAGLAAGDTIISVDGIRAQAANLDKLIAAIPAGGSVRVHAFRRDELLEFQVRPQPAAADTCDLGLIAELSAPLAARRDAWLRGAD
jgi:predicted metalloprotease with PDZ domain